MWASPKIAPIADRSALQERFDEAEARFADDGHPVPRPDFWGGYRLAPETVEFWQNRADRLHDRVRYTRRDDGWVIERLAAQTNFDIEESAERFQRDLERLGADAALRSAGIQAGDTVRVGSLELEWGAEPWSTRR